MPDQCPDPPYDIPDCPIAPGVQALKQLVEEQFADDAALTNRRTRELWDGDEACSLWFEEFVERTNEAIRRRDETVVIRHLNFFSDQLSQADNDVRDVIDVNYVENLLYDLDNKSRQWGWRRIPANLKELYIAFWGKISPGKIQMLEGGSRRKRPRDPGV